MQLHLRVFANGGLIYQRLCFGDNKTEAWADVAAHMNDGYKAAHNTQPYQLTNLQILVREVPTEAEDRSAWMELP